MTQEEKAKRYDEAIEIAKTMIDDLRKGEDILSVSNLEAMFPELVESEDERIRKELIKFINDKVEQGSVNAEQFVKHKSWVDWLKKQAEQKSTDTDNKFLRMQETKPANIVEFLDRLTTVEQEFLWEHIAKIKELDKKEQKPTDNEIKKLLQTEYEKNRADTLADLRG